MLLSTEKTARLGVKNKRPSAARDEAYVLKVLYERAARIFAHVWPRAARATATHACKSAIGSWGFSSYSIERAQSAGNPTATSASITAGMSRCPLPRITPFVLSCISAKSLR